MGSGEVVIMDTSGFANGQPIQMQQSMMNPLAMLLQSAAMQMENAIESEQALQNPNLQVSDSEIEKAYQQYRNNSILQFYQCLVRDLQFKISERSFIKYLQFSHMKPDDILDVNTFRQLFLLCKVYNADVRDESDLLWLAADCEAVGTISKDRVYEVLERNGFAKQIGTLEIRKLLEKQPDSIKRNDFLHIVDLVHKEINSRLDIDLE